MNRKVLAAVSSNAVVIDFDMDAGGGAIAANTNITTQYSSLGVTFSAFEDGLSALAWTKSSLDAGTPPSSPNIWSNCGAGAGATSCGGDRADLLRAVFDFDVESVSWMLDSLGSSFSFSVSGIRRIDMVQPSDSWGWAMDNLAFSAVAVPATAGVLLLGIGVAGLLVNRKKLAA